MNNPILFNLLFVEKISCKFCAWNWLSVLGRTSNTRTWHDVPADIIKIIDEYTYAHNAKETIWQIHHHQLQITDIYERQTVLQSAYLSVAVDYFINRDYGYALRRLKKAESAYHFLRKADEGFRRQSESIHFYTCLLWGIILYIKGYDRRARHRLKKCIKSDSNPAIEKFIDYLE